MGNAECRQNTGRICSEDDSPALSFDDNFPNYNETTINRGTIVSPKPQLKFHSICGTNIILLRDGRVAKRRESFCKGLAFSNRPIGIGEIVCIRLCEVGNNWSGVMRFGVTNVDPASFRDIELPKFACPDLTSKGGYWAKSLAERFSVQGLILHFFINDSGEMHYGVNGVHKGLFLSGINVNSPLWTIVDIYGNSVAVEFVDPAEVHLERRALLPSSPTPLHACCSLTSPTPNPVNSSNTEAMTSSRSTQNLRNMGNSATSRSTASSTPPTNNNNRDARLRFHSVKGNNVVIQNNGTTAVRKHGEYYLGYVFTERPIRIGEKIVILVSMTEDAFSGSLAFGLTSCDPDQVPASHLPADSDELLERPEYWVCIKDVGASPQVGTTLNFKVDCTGRVLFSKNDAPFRVIMHVDVSIPLWAFFDLYGSTRKIQILDLDQPLSPAEYIAMRGHRASSEGAASAHGDSNDTSLYTLISPTTRLSRPSSAQWNMESLRVALPEPLSITPPTQSTAVSATTNSTSALSETTTSTPSFSAPSYSLHEPRDLTNLRVANTLRRLNQQQADLLAEANSSINLASNAASTTTAAAISSSTNSPSAYSTPLFSSPFTSTLLGGGNNSNNSESSSQAVNDFINNFRQIQRERMQNHSRSPVRPINNQRGNNNNAAANLFEFPNAPTTTNSGASITVPLLPAPLFSSLNVPSNEQQNLRNRAAEFEAALSSSLSSDHSPNRRPFNEGNRQSSGEGGTTTTINAVNNNNDADAAIQLEDGDRNNECTICMTNRVNAVIYRCGHMCMCFPCAKETHRRSGDCPICRTPIIDVIRCYPV